ncbi:MAG: glycosyltransferase [Thermoleophilia bacterium]
MTVPRECRIDLHLHTRASTDTGSWFLNRAVMPESFTDPALAYATAKRRGMDFVAITDHNTISGALEIAHHPDVVVGVEITTSFPADRVPLHVLAWGVDEAAWADLDRARESVDDLLGVLAARGLPHALAHPLHRVGGDLTADHLERCLLMFPVWEGLNGARPAATNEIATRIARSAGRDYLARLAEKHGMEPRGDGPPALTGGSDDHGSYDIACAWTALPPAADVPQLLGHLRAGRTRPEGAHGSATALAHSVGSLGLKAWLDGAACPLPDGLRRLVGDILQHPVGAPAPTAAAAPAGEGLGSEAWRRLRSDRGLIMRYRRLGRMPEGPARSHARIRLATGWAHESALSAALSGGLRLERMGARLEALLAAAAAAAPYLIAAGYVRDEERFAGAVAREFFGEPLDADRSAPALMLTDTFDELNGVAGTMRRLASYSTAHPERGITVVTCGARAGAGNVDLRPAAGVPVPAYGDRAWRMGVPSVIDLVDLVERTGARAVHSATPGPLGLAGLLVARALGLPFLTTHHTEMGAYALELTGDRLAAQIAGSATAWFHRQADRVYVPTRAAGRGLMAAGVDPQRIYMFGRGVDTGLFRPDRRGPLSRRRLGAPRGATTVLYVGRLSREKGLPLLADAFRRASAAMPGLHLALVGEGPARAELARLLAGTPHRLVGALTGRALAAAYASADLFVLPSATETYGQVVHEAAASGLPTIVLDEGAAHESVEHDVTGLVCPAADPRALAAAILALAGDPRRRARLGAAGRERALARAGWEAVFDELTAGYAGVRRAPAPGAAPPRVAAEVAP